MYHSTSISILFLIAIISPSLAAPSFHLRRAAASTCEQYNPITFGPFEVQNDAWGAIPGGSSCVEIDTSSAQGSVAWSSTFNWGGAKDAIKSFANAQAAGNIPCKPLNQYQTMPSSWEWS